MLPFHTYLVSTQRNLIKEIYQIRYFNFWARCFLRILKYRSQDFNQDAGFSLNSPSHVDSVKKVLVGVTIMSYVYVFAGSSLHEVWDPSWLGWILCLKWTNHRPGICYVLTYSGNVICLLPYGTSAGQMECTLGRNRLK